MRRSRLALRRRGRRRRAPAGPGNGAQCRRPGAHAGRRPAVARPCGWSSRDAGAPAEFVLAPPQPVAEAPPAVPVKSLADIAALADANRDIAFKVSLKHYVRLVRIEPGRLDVSLTADAPKTLLGDLTTKLKAWTGRQLDRLAVARGRRPDARRDGGRPSANDAILDARSDPAVAAILARFPGAKIIDVRIPNAPEAEAGDADLPPEPAADDDETDF